MHKFRVLLIDDKDENIYTLRLLLNDNFPEVEVYEALSVHDALLLIMKYDISLILSDIQMPDVSGFDLVNYLNGIDETKNIPVVLVTAKYLDDTSIKKGFTLGATDYLCKPIDIDLFCEKIEVYKKDFESRVSKIDELSELERKLLEDMKVKMMLDKLNQYDLDLSKYEDFLNENEDDVDLKEIMEDKKRIDELMQ